MPAGGSKETRDARRMKLSKLSLRKKSQKDGPGTGEDVQKDGGGTSGEVQKAGPGASGEVRSVVPSNVDLDETCEFKEPFLFEGVGQQTRRKGRRADPGFITEPCPQTSATDAGASKSNPEKVKDELVAMATGEASEEDVVKCQVCSKSLSHMSSQRRQQHVNRCIDKTVERERADQDHEELLVRARTAVLDCPMCGKGFKTDTARLSHLKKCSQSLGVATETVLKLTKDQEQERRDLLAKGVLPDSMRNLKVTSAAQSKQRKAKEPKSKYEEDVQVAMAISSSIAEQEKLQGQDLFGKLPDLGATSKGQGSKRGKKKPVYEDVCLLTTLSEVDKQRRLEEKVNNILIHEGISSVHSQARITLLASELQTDSARNGSSRVLWEESLLTGNQGCTERFYVATLVPPLVMSTGDVGSRAKKTTKIPGRDVTFIEEKTDVSISECGPRYSEHEDAITASTQTAVVLAELAMDDTSLDVSQGFSQERPDTSLLDDTQCSGYCVPTLIMKNEDRVKEKAEVLLDYKRLVNNPEFSDMKIITSVGQTLHAHSVILLVRCPKMLKMAENSIVRLDASLDITMSLVNYIYTGELTLTAPITELENLAKQLELSALANICKNLVPSAEISENMSENNAETKTDDKDEFIESSLDLKQIWGESDSDSDDENDKRDEGLSDNCDDDNTEVDDEDYHDIMCTQRRIARSSKSEDMEEKPGNIDVETEKMDDDDISLEYNSVDENKCLLNEEEESTDSKIRDKDSMSETVDVNKETGTVRDTSLNIGDGDRSDQISKDVCKSIDSNNTSRPDVFDDSIVLSSDDEIIPSPKRVRLSNSQEIKFDSEEQITAKTNEQDTTSENVLDKVDDKVSSTLSNTFSHHTDGKSMERTSISISKTLSTSIDNVSEVSFNQSGADLFCSPTPVKRLKLSDEEADIVDMEKDTLPDIKTAKRKLDVTIISSGNSVDNSILLTDSDSDKSELDDMGVKDEYGCKLVNLETEISHMMEMKDEKEDLSGFDNSTVESHNSSTVSHVYEEDSNSADRLDDDLEITGDNFEELLKGSPVFKDKKFKRSNKNTVIEDIDRDTENMDDNVNQCFDESFKSNDKDNGNVNTCFDESFRSNDEDIVEISIDKAGNAHELDEASESIKEDELDKHKMDCRSDNEKGSDVEIRREDNSAGIEEEVSLIESCDEDVDKAGARRQLSDGSNDCSIISDKVAEVSEEGADTADNIPGSSEADVWEDFDDDGMDYVPPVESPDAATSMDEQGEDGVANTSFQDGNDSFVFQVDTHVDDNPSTSQPPPQAKPKETFVTPTMRDVRRMKKPQTWVPPSPFTPMPQYDKMATPEIKKAVQRYGVKPVGKKRMVKVLKDIYQQTHQYETDSDCEEPAVVARSEAGTSGAGEDRADSGDDGEPSSSQGTISDPDSDASEGCDVFEESCLHMISSDSDASPQVSPQKSVDVHRQIFTYIKRNPTLHNRILMYEPLELDILKGDLKEAKVKCSMDKLMDFLDERCIAFTTKNSKNSRRGRQKKKGSPKKGSPKKASTKSPKKRGRPKASKAVTSSQSSQS